MGTWGTKPFENDDALDLIEEFEESGDITLLSSAIEKVLKSEYIEAPDASEAIAAAELIRTVESISEDIKQKSRKVVRRILDDSELRELWTEAGELDEWKKDTEHLML